MKISACMIVKNEERMLKQTLPNLLKLVDEVILVDTGSADSTVELAEKAGAKVFHFKWINDFSAARNESLKHATGDWILWVDADEFIKAEDMEQIKKELENSEQTAYSLKVSECREGKFDVITYNFRPKMFRNGQGIHFERPINEQPFTKDGKHVFDISKKLEVPIYHWGGNLEADLHKKKRERNIEILKSVIEKGQGDAAYYYLLGSNYKLLGMHQQAIEAFNRVIELNAQGRIALGAREDKAWSLYHLKKAKETYSEAMELLKLDPENASALNLIGSLLLAMGELDKAAEALKQASSAPQKEDAIRVNDRQKVYVSNLLLSQVYLKQGKKEEAGAAAQKAYDFDPTEEARQALERTR